MILPTHSIVFSPMMIILALWSWQWAMIFETWMEDNRYRRALRQNGGRNYITRNGIFRKALDVVCCVPCRMLTQTPPIPFHLSLGSSEVQQSMSPTNSFHATKGVWHMTSLVFIRGKWVPTRVPLCNTMGTWNIWRILPRPQCFLYSNSYRSFFSF